jgi:hypothetical protein
MEERFAVCGTSPAGASSRICTRKPFEEICANPLATHRESASAPFTTEPFMSVREHHRAGRTSGRPRCMHIQGTSKISCSLLIERWSLRDPGFWRGCGDVIRLREQGGEEKGEMSEADIDSELVLEWIGVLSISSNWALLSDFAPWPHALLHMPV